jgi:hypothetical protein
VTVRKAEKNTLWQPTQWGDAVVIQQLSAIRQQNPMEKPTSMLAVWVPAFQRYYLIDDGEKPFRIFPTISSDPLLEDSSLDLGVGLPSKPANLIKILTKLKEEALAFNEEEGVR